MNSSFSAFRGYDLIFTKKGTDRDLFCITLDHSLGISARLFLPKFKSSNLKKGSSCFIFYEFFFLIDPHRGGIV